MKRFCILIFLGLWGNGALALQQGLKLIGADQIRHQYDGTGVSIAIIDSGVDSTHPMLGGSKACDQEHYRNDKVIGGWDSGEQDPLPCDIAAHGTSVAGIAAGLIPPQPAGPDGDYVGGVAPGAKIYALKITKANGKVSSNAYLDALRWVAYHWNDDPENPIKVISNSNTWGKVEESCDASTNNYERKIVAVLNQLDELGITIFNSAGNAGFKQGLQWPGCMSLVHAVGAVSDTTQEIIGSSNSGALLSFFAPANRAITLAPGGKYRVFGTTSAAAPYAAGSAAVIQQAAKDKLGHYLTPAEVVKLMTETGVILTDPASDPAISRPRVNLGKAIDQLK